MRISNVFNLNNYFKRNPENVIDFGFSNLWKKVDIFNDGSCKSLLPFNGDYKDYANFFNLIIDNGTINYNFSDILKRKILYLDGNTFLKDTLNLTTNNYNAINFSFWLSPILLESSLNYNSGIYIEKIFGFSGSSDMAVEFHNDNSNRIYYRSNINYTDIQNAFIQNELNFYSINISKDSNLEFFRNGILIGTSKQYLSSVSTPFSIGRVIHTGETNYYPYKGNLANLRVFNRNLSSDEINYLYKNKC